MAVRIQRAVRGFHGGLRLPGHKAAATETAIAELPVPKQLIIPLQQHVGNRPELCVRVGERVLKGQMIAKPDHEFSAAVHASSSGIVRAIEPRPIPHPLGEDDTCVIIDTDGRDEGMPLAASPNHELSPETLRQLVLDAGIVGLGGAAFPTASKLDPPDELPITTLIVNGAECEPYISCDDMLMREQADQVIGGIEILLKTLGCEACLIGVEEDKPLAQQALAEALEAHPVEGVRLFSLPHVYPIGGENQIIEVLTGKQVPSGALPWHLGVVCLNVGTVAAIYRAAVRGEPVISRVVTVTGQGVTRPANVRARIGTPFADLVQFCGGYTDTAVRLIMGGAMMGFAVADDRVPVVKATNCVLVASREEAPATEPALPCIRCGDCAAVCPARLLPQQLYADIRTQRWDAVEQDHVEDCIECGCCDVVCPSHIPLVDHFRQAKDTLHEQALERAQADLARQRYAAHTARLAAREQRELDALEAKTQALKQTKTSALSSEAKKAAILAAVERKRAKQNPTDRQEPDA
ncbi:MAG: electron transport complex subunit RsxC [Pseudomonadota bacterium]|nr:electron transport complex subunit RsxC [Pseudomonadota bacterium]